MDRVGEQVVWGEQNMANNPQFEGERERGREPVDSSLRNERKTDAEKRKTDAEKRRRRNSSLFILNT